VGNENEKGITPVYLAKGSPVYGMLNAIVN